MLNKTAKQKQSVFASNVSLEAPAIDQHAEVDIGKLRKCLGFVRQLMEWTTPLMGTSIRAPDEQQGSSISGG